MTSLHQATTATEALEQSLTDVYDFTPAQAAALAATIDPADIEPGSVAGIAQRLAASGPCTHTAVSSEHLAQCCSDGVNCDRCGQLLPGIDLATLLLNEAPICWDCAPEIEP